MAKRKKQENSPQDMKGERLSDDFDLRLLYVEHFDTGSADPEFTGMTTGSVYRAIRHKLDNDRFAYQVLYEDGKSPKLGLFITSLELSGDEGYTGPTWKLREITIDDLPDLELESEEYTKIAGWGKDFRDNLDPRIIEDAKKMAQNKGVILGGEASLADFLKMLFQTNDNKHQQKSKKKIPVSDPFDEVDKQLEDAIKNAPMPPYVDIMERLQSNNPVLFDKLVLLIETLSAREILHPASDFDLTMETLHGRDRTVVNVYKTISLLRELLDTHARGERGIKFVLDCIILLLGELYHVYEQEENERFED